MVFQAAAGDGSVSSVNFRSGASVISMGTAKSTFSKLSKKSDCTQDAMMVSRATAQAVQAAKAILNAGGSEMTALKTAKAAAISALMPDSADNDASSSGIGTSFLRRRKLKRQAEVVASMALASAMANNFQSNDNNSAKEWDQDTSAGSSLQGLKLVNGPTTSVTLSSKSRSSGTGDSERSGSTKKPIIKKRPSATEIFAQQLRLLPTFASTFSSGDGLTRQESSSTRSSSRRDGNMYNNMRLRHNSQYHDQHHQNHQHHHHQNRQQNCMLFPDHSGCIQQSFSDEASTDTERYTIDGAMNNVMDSIASVLSCGPSFSMSINHRPREVRIPNIGTEDYYNSFEEETITFVGNHQEIESKDSRDDIVELSSGVNERTVPTEPEQEQRNEEVEEEQEEVVVYSHQEYNYHEAEKVSEDDEKKDDFEVMVEEQGVEAPATPAMESIDSESIADILEDLMAITPDTNKNTGVPCKLPAVITSGRSTIELEVKSALDSMNDESSVTSSSSKKAEVEEHDENSNYIDIVTPRKRSRRLARGYYNKLGDNNTDGENNNADAEDTTNSPSNKTPAASVSVSADGGGGGGGGSGSGGIGLSLKGMFRKKWRK